MHCVDLGESFPMHIFLQNLAPIQLRTSPVKVACSPRTDLPVRIIIIIITDLPGGRLLVREVGERRRFAGGGAERVLDKAANEY